VCRDSGFYEIRLNALPDFRFGLVAISAWHPLVAAMRWFPSPITTTGYSSPAITYTTGCLAKHPNFLESLLV
jgi:hypothetical protein